MTSGTCTNVTLLHTKQEGVMWISKKKYNELLEQKAGLADLAGRAVEQNGRLLDEWGTAIKEMESIHELNRRLVRHNDELIARVKDLEAKLDSATDELGYYYYLFENTYEAMEG